MPDIMQVRHASDIPNPFVLDFLMHTVALFASCWLIKQMGSRDVCVCVLQEPIGSLPDTGHGSGGTANPIQQVLLIRRGWGLSGWMVSIPFGNSTVRMDHPMSNTRSESQDHDTVMGPVPCS